MIEPMARPITPLVPAANHIASAYLFITGPGREVEPMLQRWLAELAIDPIDQVWTDGHDKISIEAVRSLQRDILLAAVRSPKRAGVMPNAQRLTADAAHALLKVLEDPPPHALLILTAEYEDQLLGTVVSRCQRWHVTPAGIPSAISAGAWSIDALRKSRYADRLARAEAWAKSETFVEQFDQLIVAAREALFAGRLSPTDVERLLTYRSLASTNVTPRLLADAVLLSLGKESQ